ncbi:putative acyl transferase acyl hydrolase lysophospholipase [Rosellinia necatrix]|uniref:Putative acyl transferase acyl hydrolase lysophospholipase n=1 Tax=Rosellinia necatrix TaxID=77044 RepID=A0A1S8A5J7_ROSNE|nr:putative acyl transferase acyl hydrolase lysophospholipase [Rosellinia necatrix]
MVDYKTHTEEGFLQNTQASIVQVPDVLSGGEGCELPLNQAKATDAAMITYTSGTTGVPKGSVIRHASYKNFCEFSPPRWPIGLGTETVLQQSSYAFDLSIAQILICVCYGGTLAIISEEQRRDPAAICSLIVRIGVTFTIATPTEYFAWLRHDNGRLLRDSQWRTAITAGEAVTSPLVQAFTSLCRPDIRLVNVYGPSETTIGCADQLILPSLPPSEFGDGLSVLPNYSICIVDADLKPLPIGVPGQILIGGAGVAEGYFKNNKHAASTFMHDNQASASFVANGWVLAHASGDRGRFDSQGRLVLHGRMADSTQIKMGGVRIDLQDIEATIMATSHRIYQAVVSHRVDSVSTREFLVAFLVMSDRQPENAEDSDSDRDTFIERLIRDLPLPQIMRPSIAITVGALPMTISNKIDRLAVDHMPLAEPNRMPGYNNQRDSMLDEFENMLCSLWEEALPADIVRSLIRERLNISIPIMKLFGASTIAQMAALLQDQPSWNSRAAPEMIDWEKETTVRDDFASLPQSDYRQRRQLGQHSSVIILTGSTGFLGQRILGQLVLDSTVSKIHCIAVRKAPRSLHGLFANTKVTVHHGDLRLKQLGLPDHAATAIFAEASAVVHCGANVSFLESYHTLRHTNLASTRELARLSIPYRLPLHYISTASVTQLTRAPAWGAASVAAFPPVIGQLNGFGYKSSKWASERFLERVSEKFGLPVVVHRPTSITGEGASGTDLLGNVMRFARVAKAVPDARGWSGYLDFVGVDTVAKKVVGEVAGSVREGREGRDGSGCDIRYVYENGDTVIGVEHLREYLEGIIGETPSVMSFQGWVDALARAGMNPFLVQYLKGVDGDGGVWLFPKLLTDP